MQGCVWFIFGVITSQSNRTQSVKFVQPFVDLSQILDRIIRYYT